MANRFGDEEGVQPDAPVQVNRFGDPVYTATATAQGPQHWSDRLGLHNPIARGATDLAEGAVSGAASTVFHGGDLIRRLFGMERVINRPEVQQAITPPDSLMGKAGNFIEQGAEFAAPMSAAAKVSKGATLIGRMAAEALASAGTTAVQTGGDPGATGTSAALGAVAPAVGPALKAAAPTLGLTAERIYQSALKPTWAMMKSEGSDMLKTGLKEQIPVSHEGIAMVEKKVADLQKQITDGISQYAAQGRTIDSTKVLQRLDDLYKFYENTAAPEKSLEILDGLYDQFKRFHGEKIPIEKAQQIKVNTYRELRDAYHEMKSAKIEGLKQITRGVKEEIESVFPEAADLNNQQMKDLGLEDALYRAVWRIENHQLAGIGSPIAATAGHAVMGGPGAVVGMLGKFVLDDPTIKSKLAIALARKGARNPMGEVTKRMLVMKSALQDTISAAGRNDQPIQMQPQPEAVPLQ